MRNGSPKKVFKVSLVVGALLISACLATQAQAAVTNGEVTYNSIQECINAASPSDTCLVSAKQGNTPYYENLNIEEKSISLKSDDNQIINGGCAGPVITILGTSSTINVDGFTIENGCNPQGAGGGITIDRGTVNISNSTFKGNSAAAGGAIAVRRADLTINDSKIETNHATGTVDTTLTVECTLPGYSIPLEGGGGIFSDCYSFLTLNNTKISGNVSSGDAGGIFSKESFIVSNFSEITGNDGAAKGGGIYYAGTGTLFISNNNLIGCNHANIAGGLYNQSGSQPTELINSTVAGNTANAVGGVFSLGGSPLTFVNTIVHQNFPNTPAYDEVVTCSAYSDIDTGTEGIIIPGEWNINANPLFVDPVACNFRLLEESPCINTGTSSNVSCSSYSVSLSDLDGKVRPQGVSHDMGAYEVTVCIGNDQATCEALPECEWVWRGTKGLCANYVPPEICDNGIDDNDNGLIDCDDAECAGVCPNSCSEITDQTTCESSPLVCEWDGTKCIDPPIDSCNEYNGDYAACKAAGCSYNKKNDTCNTK